MREEHVSCDVTVVGGGLAGVCAAIAAARLGRSVALIQNRPVLGGNSSSEVRVWVCGATAHGQHRFARETGIMGELFVENQFCNIDGNPYFWDLTVLEAVLAESNIQLYLNTDVHEVNAEGPENDRRITSVTAWMMGSERRIQFESPFFLDCTGDGLIGFLAGAKYRIGREAREEYGEPWAPEVADDVTLGSTLLFYTKDVGHKVTYRPPSFAKDITSTSIPLRRVIRSGDNGCHYWWIEWGGELDIVSDNERIRDELQSVIYGIWDYIKNSGKFDADNMTLEWIGALPGKREYRRFVGDYVLTQNDIVDQVDFPDKVAFGGWSIDLHPPGGMYATEAGSKHWHVDGSYHIPFRSLYSVNVSNLLFAGRDISASHVAFGTTRVMATCAVVGEAAGTGAALCVQYGITTRELVNTRLSELTQTLLRQDGSVVGLRNEDASDLARTATVRASSCLQRIDLCNGVDGKGHGGATSTERVLLDRDAALLFPVSPSLKGIDLLVDIISSTTLQVELWSTGKPQNYVPIHQVLTTSVSVTAGEAQWVPISLPWRPDTAQNAMVVVRANDAVSLHVTERVLSGVLSFTKRESHVQADPLFEHGPNLVQAWPKRYRSNYCFRVHGETDAYQPASVTDGYRRPFGGPHMWVSEPLREGIPEWLELTWQSPIRVSEMHITFNDDVNEDLINLHHHRTPFESIPELVRDYTVEAFVGGEWTTVAEVEDNHRRTRVHQLPTAIETDKLRIITTATNGCPRAEIVEVRVYS